jgi:general secretion pathway protein E
LKDKLLDKLGERLSADKLSDCLRVEAESGQTLDKVILRKGLIPEEDLLSMFADAFGYEFKPNLEGLRVPETFTQKVPMQFARNYVLLGIGERDGTMQVATSSPFEVYPMDELANMLQMEIEPVFVPRMAITATLNKAYRHSADVVDEAIETIQEDSIDDLSSLVSESEDLLDVANKAPIIKLVNMIMFQALKMRASDIHLQGFEDRLQIRYRIDGVLYDMEAVPKKVQDAVISRVKVMGKMDIAERRIPQDGRATIKIGDSEIDVRISSVPTNYGERIVMRLLDKTTNVYRLNEIGLSPEHLDTVRRFSLLSHGIIFVTGPTGSGKTTTLYGMLSEIKSGEKNVITIEDPIEYHLSGISQIQVSNKKGLTFAAGLRSLLRQDPDIMMVGEVRDEETAKIAMQASLTGHLVLTTLHSQSAPSAVARLKDMGVDPGLISAAVNLIVAQRLARRLCLRCRRPAAALPEELEELGVQGGGEVLLYSANGCDECTGTGYKGRVALYEMMPIARSVLSSLDAGTEEIYAAAVAEGMATLRQDGCRLCLDGVTTLDEVRRVAGDRPF